MKRIILLILSLVLFLTSCNGQIKDMIDSVLPDQFLENDGGETGDNLPDDSDPDDADNPEETHNYVAVVTDPTCVSEGFTTYTCQNCGYCYTADTTDATGHSYKSTVIFPTCENDGHTIYACSTCGDSYISDKTSATGHRYRSEVTSPTCTTDGYTTYICYTCSYSYKSGGASALGHSWVDATTEAPKTCSSCGITEGDKLPDTDGGSTDTHNDTLYISYIDVGQGDSILIKIGDCDILIDAGTVEYGSTVSNYLKAQGVDDIELMINTHPDADHCGGLTQVLKDYVVEQVWVSKYTNKNTSAYNNFKNAIKNEGLTAVMPNAGVVFTYEYLTLTVLFNEIASDVNNSSIVVMVEYGSFRFLFTGDIGEETETKLVSSGADLKCDVLKVGHHGSKSSSTSNFLKAVGAEYGVICVGVDNGYGHPTSATLNRLSSAKVSVYRTDLNGDVVFSTNGSVLYLPDGSTDTTGSGEGVATSKSIGEEVNPIISQSFVGYAEANVLRITICNYLPVKSEGNNKYGRIHSLRTLSWLIK